jgi:glycosyltransferase involved in cell wall biosynthesis
VDEIQKDRLLKKATALIAPTLYHEPFGNVVIEALLRGTPVITTDRGAFTETVQNAVNGYRCTWASEFEEAADQVSYLDRLTIALAARSTYSFETIASRYEAYCRQITQASQRHYHPKQKIPIGLDN